MDAGQREFIDRALTYPYAIERLSYLFVNGTKQPLAQGITTRAFHGRVPVLAYASKQSATQLWRKFRDFKKDVVIPIYRGWLHYFDVVYAAASSQYGSIPATLFGSRGTVVGVSIMLLTDAQLERMHLSEMRGQFYDFVHFTDIRLLIEGLNDVAEIWGYTHRNGCLRNTHEPMAVQEICARHRRFSTFAQKEVLSLVHRRTSPDLTIDEFILQIREAPEVQYSRTARLNDWSMAFHSPNVRVVS